MEKLTELQLQKNEEMKAQIREVKAKIDAIDAQMFDLTNDNQ